MAQSYDQYTALGGQDTYAVSFPYLKKAHVVVTKNGVAVTDYSWLSATQIKFDAAVDAGVEIKFARVTPETPLFNSADGSVLTDSQLKVLGRQAIYLAQETNDRSNVTLAAAEEAVATIIDVAAAQAAAASAIAAFDSFDDRYLGAKASDPTLDNDGNALVVGALYFNTGTGMKVWSGSAWALISAGITQAAGDVRYLQLAGGTLTGALTLPGSDPTNANHATRKSYVDTSISTAVAGVSSGWSTGDVKLTWKTTADSGWIMHNDGTIGSATSGATYANANAQALFLLIWANFSDAKAPVVGGRGASAAADWAANKRITLPKALGRSLGVAGAGAGLTSRTLGDTVGAETAASEMPAHTHSAKRIVATVEVAESVGGGSVVPLSGGFDDGGVTGSASSGDGSIPIMQPTSFWNVMVKL